MATKKTTTGITKYQKSSKMVDIVKECKMVDISNAAIMNVIEFDTGIRVNESQLQDLVETARQQVRETQIEVNVHMEEMIRYGLYKDSMRHHSMLTRLEQIIYTMIVEEAIKDNSEKNKNLILAMSNSLTKVFDAKNKTATNITYLGKTKELLDTQLEGNDSEINKKTSIMIKDKKEDVEKLVSEAIDIKDLQNNRVA